MLFKRLIPLAVILFAGSIATGCSVSKSGDGSRNSSLTLESASPGSPGSKSLMDLPGPGLGVYGYRGTPQPAGSPRGAVNLASVVTSPGEAGRVDVAILLVNFAQSLIDDFGTPGDSVYGMSLQFFKMSGPIQAPTTTKDRLH